MTQVSVEVEESIFIKVSKEQLWGITALQFDKIGDWSAGVKSSEGFGKGQNGAVCSERQCDPAYKGFKKTTEKIIDYQPDAHQFTYQITKGLPKMVVRATNQWTHRDEKGGTRMSMKVNMILKGLMGRIMAKPMQKRMATVLRENLEELKIYVETGKVHDRKAKLNRTLA
ncbi:MAG: SRPBCC family protein [Bacteroidota bacterium]